MRGFLSAVNRLVLALVTLSMAPSAVLEAQTFQGGLRGTIRDAQGVIPGVSISLVNEANGVLRETVSNDVGGYSFPALNPDVYTVRVSVSGFKKFERKGVRIGTQQFITMDVQLEVGALEETITVTGDAPLIDTTTASTGEVLDDKTLQTLPSISRMARSTSPISAASRRPANSPSRLASTARI